MKNKRERPTYVYFNCLHHEMPCFKNNMDIITNILEENNIDVPDFARRGEHKLSLEQENGKCMHGLCAWEKPISHISILYLFFF